MKKRFNAFLALETEAADSPAARNLAELAMHYSEDKSLYVIAIGAITNVAPQDVTAARIVFSCGVKMNSAIIWLR